MKTGKRSESRKRRKVIRVRVTEEEEKAIADRAAECSLSEPALLRLLGTGYQPRTKIDRIAVITLAKISSEQARLAGLLKMIISDLRDKAPGSVASLDVLINDIQASQIVLKKNILAMKQPK